MNVLDYAQRFRDESLDMTRDIDALILAQLAYFDFETIADLKGTLPQPLAALYAYVSIDTQINTLKKSHHTLMAHVASNPHLNTMELLDFESVFVSDKDTQFFAATFRVSPDQICVAFRGTDSTLVGWKEDLNMSFSKPIPSHFHAVAYLEKVSAHFGAKIWVVGHSKGGNLAVYATSFATLDKPERVQKVYNFDGPGFHSSVYETLNYQQNSVRVAKYVPKAGYIGTLMRSQEPLIIVDSLAPSILQHNPYTWRIKNGVLVRAKRLTTGSQFISSRLSDWFETIDEDQRRTLIDALFALAYDNNLKYTSDIKNQLKPTAFLNTLQVVNQMDDDLKKEIFALMGSLVKDFMNLNAKQLEG